MELKLYNTLSQSIEIFKPIDPKDVKIYSCGPTVYSRQHLGNLRAAYFVDLLKNTIRHICGYPVTHVMNITDVGHLTGDNEGDADHGEDRMEKGARQQGITARDVAKKFTDIYMEDLKLLRIDSLEYMPKATDHIIEQIAMVKELEDKGYTYIIPGDGVYMDTSKVEDYGVLTTKKNLENIAAGSRVQDAGKKNPTDFALWKFNISGKKRDMERESPWGIGFPGWHIECSAMSMKYLGKHIDIHTGGMEHRAIHHTNEICQSECAGAHHPWVNYRVHLQRLMMNGKKIAKSDGNVAFLNEVIDRGYSPEDMRYFYLQAHYRSFQDFTWEGLEAAKKGRVNLKKAIQNKIHVFGTIEEIDSFEECSILHSQQKNMNPMVGAQGKNDLIESLMDDLSTPHLLAYISTILSSDRYEQYQLLQYIDHHILKLGLFQIQEIQSKEIPTNIQLLADQRRQAKLDKNWVLADKLRDKLKEQGWEMNDGKEAYELISL